MSIFNNIFGGNSNGSSLKEFWNKIESSEDLEAAIEASKLGKVVIFKHSTRCMISKTILRNFERQIESEKSGIGAHAKRGKAGWSGEKEAHGTRRCDAWRHVALINDGRGDRSCHSAQGRAERG
jgi:hypothetical protein